MEEKDKKDVPYLVYESMMARMERIIKTLCCIIILLIVVLIASFTYSQYKESQYEDVVTTYTQEVESGEGGFAIINDGVHVNGESETDSNQED